MAGQLRVDEITNEAGTGSPSFPNGIPPASLGTGTPSSANFLRGDGAWATAGPQTGDIVTTSTALTAPNYLPATGGIYLKSSYPALSTALGTKADIFNVSPSAVTSTALNSIYYEGNGSYFYNGLFYLGGGDYTSTAKSIVSTTTDGITYTNRLISTATNVAIIAGNVCNGVHAALELSTSTALPTRAYRSTDGITWNTISSFSGSDTVRRLNTDNVNTFVADYVANSSQNNAWRSTDTGLTWSTFTVGFASGIVHRSIVHLNNTTWLAVGSFSGGANGPINNAMRVSTDGTTTWSAYTAYPTVASDQRLDRAFSINGYVYVVYLASNSVRTIYRTNNLVNWQQISYAPNNVSVVNMWFVDGVYYMGEGSTDTLWYSFDGVTFVTASIKINPGYSVLGSTRVITNLSSNAKLSYPATSYNSSTSFIVPSVLDNNFSARNYIKT
jgi:hypothetical protein